MRKRFFVIDGLGQIFRCYYAPFQHLSAPSGEPVRATYVFCQMLLQLIREQRPDYLAMAMDSDEGPVFRCEIDPQYKAHRQEPPEDLEPQIRRILEIVASQGIPIISVPGFEADDVMATLARRVSDPEVEILFVSKDKDLDQLLTERIKLFDAGTGEIIGPDELRTRKGYGPEQAVEIQTLTGDSTDNVPGVKGVGPKKAVALIAKYGTAVGVIEHADELTPALRANVLAFKPLLEVTRKLVTLDREVPFDFDLEACRWKGFKYQALYDVFNELGFRRLREQVAAMMGEGAEGQSVGGTEGQRDKGTRGQGDKEREGGQDARPPGATRARSVGIQGGLFDHLEAAEEAAGATVAEDDDLWNVPERPAHVTDKQYVLVDTEEKFREFLEKLRAQKAFAFDTETNSIYPAWAKLAGLSFSWKVGEGYYIPICGMGKCLPLEPVLEALRPIMADPTVLKTGQNLKYDLVVLAAHGVPVNGVEFDTMIASFVLDSSRRSHGMDYLASELLGRSTIHIEELIGKGKNQISFEAVDTRRACDYSAEDAEVTWHLREVLAEQLARSGLEPLFRETEMPLVEVLAEMENTGIKLDTTVLAEMGRRLEERLCELTRQIHEAVGHSFNIDSTKQLAVVLFDELKLPVIRKTATGRSTDAESLAQLAEQTEHPVPRLVREYRELGKLKGTYVDTLPKMINPRTGRVHTSFNQIGAVTGRLSSSDPNLQNIPIRTEIGRQIRGAFVPGDKDHVLLTADYSQIELRVLAHFSKDEALTKAFEEDRDIHQFVAAQVAGVPLEQVTREMRSRAKAVNFGIVYGQSAFGLARTTGMSNSEAQMFIDRYFARYPGIRLFLDQTIANARKTGFVTTILGRRRAIPDINSRNHTARTTAERLACNTPIQGSAADLIKKAMINIHRRIKEEGRPSRMLLQVHDELVFEVPRAAVEAEAEFIRKEMCSALPLSVPVKVDIAWGESWLEAK
ncbi:MAG TPA: DNA polymerase I [Phycisphaerae bacterium]|nr:DNA polymerase I [Phycisphaerae bacterium]HOJ56360.1 DNA polymerase I [Phycisphaerae bacterium]HOL28157.1 DNA polymerase I [Phycisphaerae bacterium]HPP22596.1 DNA polymerase I [Phycisphaerae bacterium]HPU32548.1 DNA polymerase I [Phycisphaerae bacterium]